MKILNALFLALFLVCSTVGHAQSKKCDIRPDSKPVKAAKTLKKFGLVTKGLYRGSRPNSDEDFAFLKKLGVKTVLSLEILGFHQDNVRAGAEKVGMNFVSVPIEGSPVPPSEEDVDAALSVLENRANYPIYIHCSLGRHRTAMVVALYRIFQQGCNVPDARAEMRLFGLPDGSVFLSGLNHYFDDHVKGLPNWDVEKKVSAP